MPEINNSAGQIQLETLGKFTDNLTGFSKIIAKKILNSDFLEKAKNSLAGSDITAAKTTLKLVVDKATQNAANAVRLKIMVILTVIVGILAILAAIVVKAAGGSVAIPIVVAVILVLIIRFISIMITKSIANKVSGIIFKSIEGEITKLTAKVG